MWERVVEHHDVGTVLLRLTDRCSAVGIHDHRHLGVQTAVHFSFIVAVAAKGDRWPCPYFQLEGEPSGKWSLSCAADRQVSDADCREIGSRGVEHTAVVQ